MAQIFLSEVGANLGARALPGGVSLFGRQIAGAQIGRSVGSLAGGFIDQALFSQPAEGPRLPGLHIMESREGAGMPNVYGRMRVGGQVIWAGDFTESQHQQGGKGGPQVNTYSYTVSFAVAICEGPNVRLERVWANGEPLALGQIVHRFYGGSSSQNADPVIEAHEGSGAAPAYRGTSYIVFEDFSLEAFGNRLPQLSFQVARAPADPQGMALSNVANAVNIIPATGEFAYATEPVRERTFPGREVALNVNSQDGRADAIVSLDQLVDELPNVASASLTVSWFGDDLRAGHCTIMPGVETRDRVTVPWSWRAGGANRASARLVSQDGNGHANYGGTPDDDSVVQMIAAMHARGLAVTMTPFLLMDVPPENGLSDPYGAAEQAAFPWRGRISASDGSATARTEIDTFLGACAVSDFSVSDGVVEYTGSPSDWGYRRFILHHAFLALASGGISAFLIGSEMRTLTRIRDDMGTFPFVDGLCVLADEVKDVLGAECAVSYAADWSEYGAYVPADSSNDVLFPLDKLWARASVDFVGVDWYPPAADWRDGSGHADEVAGYTGPEDPAYLRDVQVGGEAYDWYYGDTAARDNQVRTPISDTSHGEDWVFRQKDIENWWSNSHHARPGGVRNSSPTDWQAESKPIRFCEIGFPAVDKGTNSPNLFYDPKSSESAVPPYSSGARDDILQQRALIEVLNFWSDKAWLEHAAIWAWDARPFPAFPALETVWSDGANWNYGHWLNGRTSLSALSSVVSDLCGKAGVQVDTQLRGGLVEGYATEGVTRLRSALAPLAVAFDFDVVESGDRLRFASSPLTTVFAVDSAVFVEGSQARLRATTRVPDAGLVLTYASVADDFQPASIDLRSPGQLSANISRIALPLALSEPGAELIAGNLLARAANVERLEVSVPGLGQSIAPGDTLSIDADPQVWRVTGVETTDALHLDLAPARPDELLRAMGVVTVPGSASVFGAIDLQIIDVPTLDAADSLQSRLILSAFSDPWPGEITIEAGADTQSLSTRSVIAAPALTGVLLGDLDDGPVHRWDRSNEIHVQVSRAALQSRTPLAVLGGANRVLIETETGWEVCSFQTAELIGDDTYVLSDLLRGQLGTESAMLAGALTGARCVFVTPDLQPAAMSDDETGIELTWRVRGQAETTAFIFTNVQGKPWRPAHVNWNAGSSVLSWHLRGANVPDAWDSPDPETTALFDVEWESASGFETERVSGQSAPIPVSATAARLRAVSQTGQVGEWVSITAEAA